MTGHDFRLDGITPILSMPFDDDEDVIHAELLRQVDFLVDRGVRAVGFGFGSEITRLTEAELDDALRAVTHHAGGRIEVMATVGGGSIRVAVEVARSAARSGADVLMVRPPAGGTVADIAVCCTRIVDATGLPIVLQDAPDMTRVEMSAEGMAELVDRVPGIRAIKVENSQPAATIARLREVLGAEVTLLGGAGGIDFLNELDQGADGTVPFVALADVFVRIQGLHQAGRRDDAQALFDRLLPVIGVALVSIDTALWTFKELLRRRGVMTRGVRLRRPCEEIPATVTAELDRLQGLIDELVGT